MGDARCRAPHGWVPASLRRISDIGAVTSTGIGSRQVVTTQRWRGLLLVCAAGVIWGTIGPAVHLVHERSGFSPLAIGAYRAVAAVAVLIVAALATGRIGTCRSLLRHHWRRVVVVGLLTAAFQLLFFVAVLATGVSVATVVALGFPPVLLLILTSTQHRRLPAVGRVLTVTTATFGLVLVSVAGTGGDVAPNHVLGVLAALGSGAAYAGSADVGASLTQRHDALSVTALTMSVAGGVLVPGGLLLGYARGEVMTATDVGAWLLLGYLGVVTMAFAYVLLFAGLRSTPSGSAVVATLLEPVTAVLIAVLFLGQGLTLSGVAGSLLILAAIGSLGRREAQPDPQPQ